MTKKEKIEIAYCPKTREELQDEPTFFLINEFHHAMQVPMSIALFSSLLTEEERTKITDELAEYYADNLPKHLVEKRQAREKSGE